MRRTLSRISYLAAAAGLSLAAACGHQVSETLGGSCSASDSPPSNAVCSTTCGSAQPVCISGSWACPDDVPGLCPPPNDAGEDSGTCTGTPPELLCGYDCQGDPMWMTALCNSGRWGCPDVDIPACIEDAGQPDACSTEPPIACTGITQCTGVYEEPSCWGGQWYCAQYGECEDGGEPWDAGPPWDASTWDAQPPPPPSFSCGDLACNPSTSYCQINTGGPVLGDGGVASSYDCIELPSSCAGTSASCNCVEAFNGVSLGCGCIAEGADVIVTCAVP